MRLRNRLLLVTFGVIVFVIATPILVLYARGFQIDWANHRLVKTGAFVIKTQPTKATVYIDGKKQKTLTSDTIRFLLPKDYVVTIEKDGYFSWTKRLPVNSQFATWINQDRDFITLFFSKPQSISQQQVNFSSLSKDGTELAFVQNNKLNIYNVSNESTQSLGTVSDFHVPFAFTGNLSWTNGINVYNLFKNYSAAPSVNPASIKKMESNGSDVVVLANDQLQTIDLSGTHLIDKTVQGFNIAGETVWYVQNASLKTYNLRTKSTALVRSDLPQSTNAQIIRGGGSSYLILDNSLYAVNDNLEKIYDGVSFASYDSDSGKVLFSNNNEILLYDPQTKNSELILRSISALSNRVINFATGYVFFANENKIKAIELDGRDHRNIYTLADLIEPSSRFILNKDGSILTIFNNDSIQNLRIR